MKNISQRSLVIGIMFFVLVVSGCSLISKNNTESMITEPAMIEEPTMMDKEKTPPETVMMEKSGSYKVYSPETVAAEQKAGNKVVLFFHAGWCPYCIGADKAFTTNISKIPAGVTVLKTDYDNSGALKKKYGVTYQHTFVQIDANGEQVSKWNGGDIDNLVTYLK